MSICDPIGLAHSSAIAATGGRAGDEAYESMKRDDIKVSVYDDTALVTCHWEVHVLNKGNKIDTNARYIHVYVKRKDGWKMVAHQATRITQ